MAKGVIEMDQNSSRMTTQIWTGEITAAHHLSTKIEATMDQLREMDLGLDLDRDTQEGQTQVSMVKTTKVNRCTIQESIHVMRVVKGHTEGDRDVADECQVTTKDQDVEAEEDLQGRNQKGRIKERMQSRSAQQRLRRK